MLNRHTFSACSVVLLVLGIVPHLGCGGSGGVTGTSTGTAGGTISGTGTGGGTGSSAPGPVILVVEENHGYSTVIGPTAR